MSLLWNKYNSTDKSWKIKTIVKKSNIENAGNGRFTLKNIKKNQLIRSLKIISLKEYLKNTESFMENACSIILESYEDLDLLAEYLKENNIDEDINDIRLKLSWFIFGIDNKLCIHSHSSFYNHSNESNILYKFNKKGYFQQLALIDLDENTELYTNYKKNCVFPQFYLDWCKKYNLKDVKDNI